MKKAILCFLALLLLLGGRPALAFGAETLLHDDTTPAATPGPKETAESLITDARAFLEAGETVENLEDALFYFQAALIMDGSRTDALLGAVDVCIRLGEYEMALALMDEYAGEAPDEAVQKKFEELTSGNVYDSAGNPRKRSGYSQEGAPYVHLYTYDEQGRLSRVTWYDENGVEQDHVDVTYDEQGRRVTGASSILSGSSAGQLIHTQLSYTAEGRIASSKSAYPDGREEELRYIYDDQGLSLQWEHYTNGELRMIDRFEDYDDHGNYHKKSFYFVNGNREQLQEYSLIDYDYAACAVKTTQYDPSGRKKGWSEAVYSSDWRAVLHQISYAADGSVQYEYHTEVNE